jgi:N-acetyl sugar amidotransferase
MITYCTKCIMPSTKPDIVFNQDGVCNACTSFASRDLINWKARKQELDEILNVYKSNDGSNWDCIIPVSGGKDSTYQVLKILEYGLNPLCVTATTCDLSAIGRNNIENIKSFGVDYIEITPNRKVRARLNRLGLERVGDIAWPEHLGIFTIPVRAAVHFKVPLIIWGENSQNEYGGPAASQDKKHLDRRWLEEFGGLLGLRVSDLLASGGFKPSELINYTYPSNDDLSEVGVTGLFLGYYLPWDGMSNSLIAQCHGFTVYDSIVEGSMVNYENLDNHQHGIHDYFKYLKFGFGRATDIACLHVRRGRLSRSEALDIVKQHEGKFPGSYLGKSLGDILEPLEITEDYFRKICDRYTNKKIFLRDNHGEFIRDQSGDLIKTNWDNQ